MCAQVCGKYYAVTPHEVGECALTEEKKKNHTGLY